jgi:superfamily II DNA or RNA helicase
MAQGLKSILVVAPTGAGKTVMFSYFTKLAVSKGNRVLIIAHRAELLDQIATTLKTFDVSFGLIKPGVPYDPRPLVHVASVLTVVKRLDKILPPTLIISDESHHLCKGSSWHKVSEYFKAWLVGVTATPCRLSGEPLGEVFDHMILGPTTLELINQGSLCPFKYYAPTTIDTSQLHTRGGDFAQNEASALMDRPAIIGSAIAEYNKFMPGKRAVVFCTSIKHAEHIAENFNDSNIPAVSIDGKIPHELRAHRINKFKNGDIKILTNCGIVSEGFDLPAMDGIIMLRPTQSLSLYLQMIGRALRPAPNKTHAIILDHVGNVLRHGLPDQDREWSLNTAIKQNHNTTSSDNSPSVRLCDNCFAAMPSYIKVCLYCGAEFKIQSRAVKELAGELSEVDADQLRREQINANRAAQSSAKSLEDLIALGKMRGMKNPAGWARHVMSARAQKRR